MQLSVLARNNQTDEWTEILERGGWSRMGLRQASLPPGRTQGVSRFADTSAIRVQADLKLTVLVPVSRPSGPSLRL